VNWKTDSISEIVSHVNKDQVLSCLMTRLTTLVTVTSDDNIGSSVENEYATIILSHCFKKLKKWRGDKVHEKSTPI